MRCPFRRPWRELPGIAGRGGGRQGEDGLVRSHRRLSCFWFLASHGRRPSQGFLGRHPHGNRDRRRAHRACPLREIPLKGGEIRPVDPSGRVSGSPVRPGGHAFHPPCPQACRGSCTGCHRFWGRSRPGSSFSGAWDRCIGSLDRPGRGAHTGRAPARVFRWLDLRRSRRKCPPCGDCGCSRPRPAPLPLNAFSGQARGRAGESAALRCPTSRNRLLGRPPVG